MDLTFAHALLSKGFERHAWEDFTLVKQIEYDGKPVEAAWALGTALNSM
jgi:apyrase